MHVNFKDLGFIAFYWAGFTAAQRERAQEDFKVLYQGAPPHLPPPPKKNSHTKGSHGTGIYLLFSNSA